jgi:hypothetical protein
MGIVKAAAISFGVGFGAGFVLGTLRALWVVPRLGVRAAELLEAPVMLAVTVLAARWVAAVFILGAGLSVGCRLPRGADPRCEAGPHSTPHFIESVA